MNIKYKLTNQNLQTHNGCQWVIGKWKETDGSGDLCGEGWLHYYDSPLLAVLHNPIHANIKSPRLFEVEVDGDFKDDNGLKGGCTKMRLVKEISLPEITIEQRIKYAILCAKRVCSDKEWNVWADNWLSGVNRGTDAAYAAYDAAAYAAYAAAARAARAAAAAAAYAAARAAARADAAAAAYAADATYAAAYAAYAELNLVEIAKEAIG